MRTNHPTGTNVSTANVPTANVPTDGTATPCSARSAFEEPRLTFLEPQLVPRGDLRNITAGAFGSFSNVDGFPPPPGPL